MRFSFWKITAAGMLIFWLCCTYQYRKKMKGAVAEKESNLEDMQKRMIFCVADLIEKRDDTTGQHAKRTSAYVRILAKKLKELGIYPIDEEYIEKISNVAPLHDVGKMVISDSILKKPGKLTEEEFATMKEHPLTGKQMLDMIIRDVGEQDYFCFAYEIVLNHHEKWDGSGYPYGIAGENIPLSARIMAVADVFDALISKRCYKDAYSFEQAFEMIKKLAGTHLDPVLVEAFLDGKEEIKKVVFINS